MVSEGLTSIGEHYLKDVAGPTAKDLTSVACREASNLECPLKAWNA